MRLDGEGSSLVAGIDLAAGRGTTEVALLAVAHDVKPIFSATAHRRVEGDNEILTVLAEAHPRVVAIDAPLSLPAAVTAALRGADPSTEGSDKRVLAVSGSPYTRAAERDPVWTELGLRPLPVSFLGGLTFRALVLASRLRAQLPDAAIIEVFPSATLRVLGVRPPQAAGTRRRREAKTSTSARAAVQAGLVRWIAGLPSPDREPPGADLLDALAAALTAVAYARGQFRAIGDPDEGQIVLPDAHPL
jgi:predicted nuclease with RNAse H fold